MFVWVLVAVHTCMQTMEEKPEWLPNKKEKNSREWNYFFHTSEKQLQWRKSKSQKHRKHLAVTEAPWDLDHVKWSVQVYPTLLYYCKFIDF